MSANIKFYADRRPLARRWRLLSLAVVPTWLLLAGCVPGKSRAPTPPASGSAQKGTENPALIVTPEIGLSGTVAQVNSVLRFAVLNFPPGRMPAPNQRLNIYRRGLKVAEVTVGPQQMNESIIADIAAGEVQRGDVVRDR